MLIATSLLQELLEKQPHLRSQMYFKSSLTALSHAMEDQVLAGEDPPIVIACFQRERFYRQEANRYLRISDKSDQVYVLAAPETDFSSQSGAYETIAFEPNDGLSDEWHLIVLSPTYSLCLVCREHREEVELPLSKQIPHIDQSRRFEGIWTFDRATSCTAAELLLKRIQHYRPELKKKINVALKSINREVSSGFNQVDPAPFADRLVTYLQAGQYKQNKAYRQIAGKERKERLVNSITTAIRRSLDPNQVLSVAVQELGQTLDSDRCIIYQCAANDQTAIIEYEFKIPEIPSLINQSWSFGDNPWFQTISDEQDCLFIEDIRENEKVLSHPSFLRQLSRAGIHSLLMVPVIHQKQLIGLIELHQCQSDNHHRHDDDIAVIEAIAAQVGVALIQAQAYADLENLNEQLANLERTRSNLIAITGHELRTPLTTIQVCLESLASEPDMVEELREVMLSTALSDAERMRKLVQDFLTLSRLESGRADWNSEDISLDECVNLALSSVTTRYDDQTRPKINNTITQDIPFVEADGEWLVEVLVKLVDNACKFSTKNDQITLSSKILEDRLMQVTVDDTGRGIEPERLEDVFERFYQEEGALQRTTGGTGLGLAICRQIIHNMGGKIWADSPGKGKGSSFSFTLPLAETT